MTGRYQVGQGPITAAGLLFGAKLPAGRFEVSNPSGAKPSGRLARWEGQLMRESP